MRVPRTSTSLVPVPVSLPYLSATSRGDSGHQFQDNQNSRCPDSLSRRMRPGRTNSYGRGVRPGRTNSVRTRGINSLCGCSGRICFWGIILSVALPGLALAGDPPPVDDSASRWGERDLQDADGIRPVDSSPADQGLSVTQADLTREGEGEDQSTRVRIETGQGVTAPIADDGVSRPFPERTRKDEVETDSLRVRVVGPEGVLVILDAEIQVTDERVRSGYLAFWTNFYDEVIYLCGRPLYTSADVGNALFSLSREFDLDVIQFAEAASVLEGAIAEVQFSFSEHILWEPATRGRIQRLIGERRSDFADGEIPSDPILWSTPKPLVPPCCFTAIAPPRPGKDPTVDDLIGQVRKEHDAGPVSWCDACVECPVVECIIYVKNCFDCSCESYYSTDECTDDNNPCTADVCNGGRCKHPPKDGSCNEDSVCCDGVCCDYGDVCCDGVCCSDCCENNTVCCDVPCCADFCCDGCCTEGELCCPSGICLWSRCWSVTGMPCSAGCDDDNPCTHDRCLDPEEMCFTAPVDDGIVCDNDGNPCTISVCSNEVCTAQPGNDGDPCEDDGDPCTVNVCSGGVCAAQPGNDGDPCADDGDPCTVNVCSGGVCTAQPGNDGAACDDDDECTTDWCQNGNCVGIPIDCTPTDPCASESSCDPLVGCEYEYIDCDDGDPCTPDACEDGVCINSWDTVCESLWPPVDPYWACTTYGCNMSMNLPNWIAVNDDDDNGNGVPDRFDAGEVSGEDDLQWVSLATPGCLPASGGTGSGHDGEDHWHPESVPGGVTMYSSLDRDQLVFNPWEPWPPPGGFYIEGGSNTASCGQRWEFGLWYNEPPGYYCESASDRIVVVKVTSLEWEKGDDSNAELGYCPNNQGRRIYPGKLDPQDGFSNDRKKVRLVATIDPPIAGVPVHFRVWDVDDPFDQANNTMPNVGLIDNDTTGPDNRGSDSVVGTYTDVTDECGQAVVPLSVSMQPGDNYRAGASILNDAINQASQTTADALNQQGGGFSGYSVPLVWSEMLTVWRKLHVETDSMARPTFAENTIDTEWNQPRFPTGTLVLDIDNQDWYDNFENGFIRIKAPGFPDLIALTITFENTLLLDDVVYTNITEAQWGGRPSDGQCTISDDDLANEARFTAGVVGSDMGVGNPPDGFLPLPDTSGLTAHYEAAYILPVVEDTYTSIGAVPFVKNINDITNESGWSPALPTRGLAVSTPTFWTAFVYSAFQAEQSEDFDGEVEATKGINSHKESIFGNTRTYSDFGPQYTGMCAIFVEALRDGFPEVTQRITVAHEMAHTLGVDHGIELMHAEVQTNAFSAQSLRELREYEGP